VEIVSDIGMSLGSYGNSVSLDRDGLLRDQHRPVSSESAGGGHRLGHKC